MVTSISKYIGSKMTQQSAEQSPAVESAPAQQVPAVEQFQLSDVRALLRMSHACESVVELIRANHEVGATEGDLESLRGLSKSVESLVAGIEVINGSRGFLPTDYMAMQTAYNVIRTQVGLEAALPEMDPKAFVDEQGEFKRVKVACEGIMEFKEEVADAQAKAAEGSIDAIVRVYAALDIAVAELKRRLTSLSQILPNVVYDETASVPVDDYIYKSLAINGVIPSDLASYFKSYGELGAQILSSFSENALNTGSLVAKLPDAVTDSSQGCVIRAIANALSTAGDPRSSIDANQLCFDLPGSGPLFCVDDNVNADDGDSDGSEVSELVAYLKRFINGPKPCPPCDMGDRPSMEADDDEIDDDEGDSEEEGNDPTDPVDPDGSDVNNVEAEEAADDASALAADASETAGQAEEAAADAEATAVASGDDEANVDPDSSPAAAEGGEEGGEGDAPVPEEGEEGGEVVETGDDDPVAPTVPEVQDKTVRVLTRKSISDIIYALIKVLDIPNLNSYAEARQAVWADIRSTPARVSAAVFQLSPSEAAELRPAMPVLESYVDLIFQMSALPAMYYLSNAVLSGYAFLLLAERSIAGKKEDDDGTQSKPDPVPEGLQQS